MKKLASLISALSFPLKKSVPLILCLFLPLTLCGCYDNREIDRTAYVIALGIDKGPAGFNYIFQISAPLAMGGGDEGMTGGGGEENSKVENIVIGAENLYEARNSLNNFLSKQVNLSHLEMIVFSAETAESGLENHFTFLQREREVRPNTHICIAEGSAEKFLRGINPALEANTANYYDLISKNGSIYAPAKTLREFVNEEAIFAAAVPLGVVSEAEESSDFTSKSDILRVSSSKSEFSGLCLMKDYKAVDYLTPFQSRIFGLLSGNTKECDISISSGGEDYEIRLRPKSKAVFTVSQGGEADTVKLAASFAAEIISSGGDLSEQEIEEYLSREVYSLFLSAQKADCDIFGAGNCIRRKCRTIREWESIDWEKRFKDAYFSPDIKVVAERSNSGTM